MTKADTPKAGHNRPPAYDDAAFAALAARARDFHDAAGAWLDLGEIDTEEQATKLNDFLTGARRLYREIDDRRKAEKQPHIDAGKEVDTAYGKLTGPLKIAAEKLKVPLTKFAEAKAEAERIEREIERKRAEAEAEAARKALAEAETRNDVAGLDETQKAAKAAEKAAASAARERPAGQVGSATGGGRTAALRSYYSAEVVNRAQAFLALQARHGAQFDELLIRLALAEHRAADDKAAFSIKGIKFHEEKRIA